jgi:hypothetical protein
MTGKVEKLHTDLGPYQEELRQFLIGAGAFPKNAVVFVSVTSGADVKANEFMFFPFLKNREPTHRQYAFMVPGLSFQPIVGLEVPPNLRRLCTVASSEGFIFQSEKMDERALVEARELYNGTKGT